MTFMVLNQAKYIPTYTAQTLHCMFDSGSTSFQIPVKDAKYKLTPQKGLKVIHAQVRRTISRYVNDRFRAKRGDLFQL